MFRKARSGMSEPNKSNKFPSFQKNYMPPKRSSLGPQNVGGLCLCLKVTQFKTE